MAQAGKAIVIPLSAVVAHLVVAVSMVLGLSHFFDWIAVRFDWSFLTAGSRVDLASILAICIGLLLTRLIGRWFLPEPPAERD